MDTTQALDVARSMSVRTLNNETLVAVVTTEGVELQGGRYTAIVPLSATVASFHDRWERYLEDHGIDVGRRWPTTAALEVIERRAAEGVSP